MPRPLERLGEFESELRARLSSEGFSDCQTIVRWSRRRGKRRREAAAGKLDDRFRKWTLEGELSAHQAIGTYLVDILAWVPTDLYDQDSRVRRIVKDCLDCASRSKRAADRGSTTWQEILVGTPPAHVAHPVRRPPGDPTA